MKKVLFLMVVVLAFMSCSSNDDHDTTDSLNGSTWISPDDGDGIRTLVFSSTSFQYKYEYEGDVNTGSGTYSYDPPTIMLKMGSEAITATINGDKLTTNPTEDGDYIVYHKQ